ncbi:MAG: hypothetical protein ACR2Q4_03375 [Geminicoccaceae bacterium]
MRRLLLVGILALAFTCAISLTVPSQHDHAGPGSLSERLLQIEHSRLGNPLG